MTCLLYTSYLLVRILSANGLTYFQYAFPFIPLLIYGVCLIITPVSYTHLDVYKRQSLSCLRNRYENKCHSPCDCCRNLAGNTAYYRLQLWGRACLLYTSYLAAGMNAHLAKPVKIFFTFSIFTGFAR